MKKAAAVIGDLGVENVVIKGGHLPGREISAASIFSMTENDITNFRRPGLKQKTRMAPAVHTPRRWLRSGPGQKYFASRRTSENDGNAGNWKFTVYGKRSWAGEYFGEM